MNIIANLINNAASNSGHRSVVSSADPRNRIPPEKREKFQAIEDNVDALHGAIPTQRHSGLFDQIAEVRQQRARFLDGVQNGGRRPEDKDRLADFDARIATVQAEIERVGEICETRSAEWSKAGNVVTNCIDFLDGIRLRLKPVKTFEPKLASGQNFIGEVVRIRDEIERVSQEREKINHAPAPSAQLCEQALAGLDRLASKGEPSVKRGERETDPLKLDRHLEHPSVATAFLLFLFRDEIADRLAAFIGPDAPGALSDAERLNKLAATNAKLLELERQEEALIVAAEAVKQRI